jgi:glycosyltransferase involved in cell wall biosynthesis
MKVSIITINRNNLQGLKMTYESIAAQSFSDKEWIVVDGDSTDGDREFIEQHASEIAWWCSEPDKGVYNAQNKGIVHARGEWMIFMNSGDIFHDKNVLESVFAQEHSADILYGDWVRVYEDGRAEEVHAPKTVSLHGIYQDNICHQAMFIRSSVMKSSPYDESYKIYADWAKWVELTLKKCRFEYLPLYVCDFRLGGMSSDLDLAKTELEIMRQKELSPAILETIQPMCMEGGYEIINEVALLVSQRKTYRRIIRFALFLCGILKKLHKERAKKDYI